LTTENWFVSTVTTPACTELATARTLRQTVKSCLRSPARERVSLTSSNIPDASTRRSDSHESSTWSWVSCEEHVLTSLLVSLRSVNRRSSRAACVVLHASFNY